MQVICRTRQMGKTTDLLEMAIDNKYIFVCTLHREKERLIQLCHESNNEPPVILTYYELENGGLEGLDPKKYTGLVIDNVDTFLQYMIGKWGHFDISVVAINQETPDANNQ